MMKKRLALLLALFLFATVFSFGALGEDRYSQIAATAQDEGSLTARFIDLGEQTAKDKPGDSTILTSPEGKVMVLDAGHPEAVHHVIKMLDAMGVTKIDYLVASHPHIDHIGGFPELIKKYEIGALYTSKVTYDSSSYYRAYLKAAEEKGLEHVYLQEGDQFQFGEQVKVEIFGPGEEIIYPERYPEGSTQFLNNHSLVMKFTFGESTLLFSGDLYTKGEGDVVRKYPEALKSDVHKINHHGIDTSSSKKWRDAVDMKIAVAMNDGISNLALINRYNKGNSTAYHTLVDGSVKVSTQGDGEYQVLTQKERETDLLNKK